jgi:hypothetical protein
MGSNRSKVEAGIYRPESGTTRPLRASRAPRRVILPEGAKNGIPPRESGRAEPLYRGLLQRCTKSFVSGRKHRLECLRSDAEWFQSTLPVSHLSFSSTSAIVCLCMLNGASAPPHSRGSMWSITYPGQAPFGMQVDGRGCFLLKAFLAAVLRLYRLRCGERPYRGVPAARCRVDRNKEARQEEARVVS